MNFLARSSTSRRLKYVLRIVVVEFPIPLMFRLRAVDSWSVLYHCEVVDSKIYHRGRSKSGETENHSSAVVDGIYSACNVST